MNLHHVSRFSRFSSIVVGAASLAAVACSGADPTSAQSEATGANQEALTGTLAITGTVTGAAGAPLAGVTVRVSGTAQETTTTAADGTYTLGTLPAGSYSVSATLAGCQFDPSVTNLNGFKANATVNFSGSGATCGGAAQNSGAVNGTLTISGTVTGSAGPVAGVLVRLNGASQGFRTTGANGTYSFSVNPGSFQVQPTLAGCQFTPNNVNENNLTASVVANFSGVGGACGVAAARDAGAADAAPPAVDAAPPASDSGVVVQ